MIPRSWVSPAWSRTFRLCKAPALTFSNRNSLMKFKLNMYKLKEGRDMKASTFSQLVATTLYEKR